MIVGKTIRRLIPVLVLTIGGVLRPAAAYPYADSEKALLGPVVVTASQVVRVSAYAVGNPNELPWDFVVRFLDARNRLVSEARFRRSPGASGFADVAIGDEENLPVDRFGRRTLRAEIVGFNPQPDPPGHYFATLEVFNARNGRTIAFVGNPDEAPQPLGVADSEKVLFGPVGATAAQVVRVSVYGVGNPNEQPWDFVVRFIDVRGQLAKEVRLQRAPGRAGFADVAIQDSENLPRDAFGRRTLRAEIVGFNPQPDPPGVYVATLEVFGAAAGRTTVFLGGPDTVPAESR